MIDILDTNFPKLSTMVIILSVLAIITICKLQIFKSGITIQKQICQYFAILMLVILIFVPVFQANAKETEREKIREEALALENALRKTIQAGTIKPVTSSTVPGFQTSNPSQSKFYNSEKTLNTQSKIARNQNPVSQSITRSIAKREKITNKELQQWAKLGTRVQNDPHSYAKGFSGSSGDCKTQISGRSTPATWEYSCDEGVTLNQYSLSCRIPLRAAQKTEYIYHCRDRWNQADCTYEPGSLCYLLMLDSNCSDMKQVSGGHCNNRGGICGSSCEDKIYETTCRQRISGLSPTKTKTSPIRFFWDTSACNSAEATKACTQSSEVCTEKARTKRIGFEPVFKNCWSKTRYYSCNEKGETKNDCQVPDSCKKSKTKCLSKDPHTNKCQNWEHNYICSPPTTPSSISGYCEEDIYCIDGDCVKTKRPQSKDFPDAITSLNMIGEVENDFDVAKLQIFPGTHAKCDKAIAGLQNCCSNDGLLLKLGANCSDKDRNVARNRENGLCHQIGTYCSKKTLFGICLKKRKTFCCFNSTLAKAIHVQGRRQIGLDWGNAKFPNCSGYTVANFQKLDLSKLDLTDFYAEVLKDFTGPDASKVSKALRDRMLRTYKCPPNCPKK